MNFTAEMPLDCSVSFGNCCLNLALEWYQRGLQPNIFLLNNAVNLAPFEGQLSQDFMNWLNSCINKAPSQFKRDDPYFRWWHIAQSWQSIGKNPSLFTLHELDFLTENEINILNSQERVLTCSEFSKEVFETYGVTKPVHYVPLGFDSRSFYKLNRTYLPDKIMFMLAGKFEERKSHKKVIRAWMKRFGSDKSNKYVLNCALHNPFMKPEEFNAVINDAFAGFDPVRVRVTVNFNPYMQSNAAYNDFLNSNQIVLAMSRAESWGLPEFQATCLGKICVGLNCSGYRGWMNKDNTILVEPNSKQIAQDGRFFVKGHPFNQGNWYDFDDDQFIAACELAIKRYESNPVNQAGLDMAKQFTWKNTADIILESLKP